LRKGDIPPGAFIEVHSESGQVWLVKGEERGLAFYYHDLGYIILAACTPFVRELILFHTLNSKVITSGGMFKPHMAGQYIWLINKWYKIHRVQDASTAHLELDASSTGTAVVPVATMNEISIYGSGINLTRLELDYIPRTR